MFSLEIYIKLGTSPSQKNKNIFVKLTLLSNFQINLKLYNGYDLSKANWWQINFNLISTFCGRDIEFFPGCLSLFTGIYNLNPNSASECSLNAGGQIRAKDNQVFFVNPIAIKLTFNSTPKKHRCLQGLKSSKPLPWIDWCFQKSC